MKIILQGRTIGNEQEFHDVLSKQLDFGSYYGNNLSALWDRMTTDVERPVQLVWKDSAVSRTAMGNGVFDKIISLFRDVEKHDREMGRGEAFSLILE